MQETLRDAGLSPGSGRSLEKVMATHSSILAWRIQRTEEPGRLQSMGPQRVGHNWSDLANTDHGSSKQCQLHSSLMGQLLYPNSLSCSSCTLLKPVVKRTNHFTSHLSPCPHQGFRFCKGSDEWRMAATLTLWIIHSHKQPWRQTQQHWSKRLWLQSGDHSVHEWRVLGGQVREDFSHCLWWSWAHGQDEEAPSHSIVCVWMCN